LRSFYRGGNYNNGANAGLFYSNGNNARSNSNGNIGFRSASSLDRQKPAHCQMFQAHGPDSSTGDDKGV